MRHRKRILMAGWILLFSALLSACGTDSIQATATDPQPDRPETVTYGGG